jgi:hypothetical protein
MMHLVSLEWYTGVQITSIGQQFHDLGQDLGPVLAGVAVGGEDPGQRSIPQRRQILSQNVVERIDELDGEEPGGREARAWG